MDLLFDPSIEITSKHILPARVAPPDLPVMNVSRNEGVNKFETSAVHNTISCFCMSRLGEDYLHSSPIW